MKLNQVFRRQLILGAAFGSAVCFATVLPAASMFISFSLDEPCKTSAGVFLPDGTLVRTLWSKVSYGEGSHSAIWDGLDDNGSAAGAGAYQVRLLHHNTEYVWDGAIGNTSAELYGPTVHTGFYPMRGLAITGTNAFYVSGYNEGGYAFRSFLTTDPQRVKLRWMWGYSQQFDRVNSVAGDTNDRNWLWTTTDGTWVYFGCSTTLNPATQANNFPGVVMACKVSDGTPAYFANGVLIPNGSSAPFPNGIYVGTQPGLCGLGVQQNGNLLAVAVAADNRVYLYDKRLGTPAGNITVSNPGRLSFSPDGSLWVISGNALVCFTNVGSAASVALTLTSLARPLDVAVNPTNSNLILVADGGGSQQVKAFSSGGTPLWTYGLAGGYPANGVAVNTNKFWFDDGENEGTFLCFAPDGSFWVGDGGNHRSLHFSAGRNYMEQIMYQPHSYVACVDQNNPSRVFNQFLEFKVDYTKPLAESWTLVNNWKVGVDASHVSWNEGIRDVTTFTNGRTYALIDNNAANVKELAELGTNGLRLTGIFPMIGSEGRWVSIGPDGSIRATTYAAARWYQRMLTGFETNGNPLWNPETLIASAPEGGRDPVPRCCSLGNVRASISTNNILISFDQSLNDGWHLGGIKVGTSTWLWKASPAVTWMDGRGTYEIANSVNYAGNTVQALDRHVIYGYHGEFFRNSGQAAQTMHFYDDGLFVGQFGEASPGYYPYQAPLAAFAGNGDCPSLTKSTNGDYYLWVNDESNHGPQRWHFVNARNIREQTGSGTLGGAITLTSPPAEFPVALAARQFNQTIELGWKPVTNATSYKVRYSLINGGPYQTIAGTATGTNFVVRGLPVGQNCYFVVTAVRSGVEGIPSEQTEVRLIDALQTVQRAGHLVENGQFTPVIEVSSSALDSNQPAFVGMEHMTGVLNLRELSYYGFGELMNKTVGTKGYVLYGWGGAGSDLSRVLPPFSVSPGSGWMDWPYLSRKFRMDGVLGASRGLAAWPVGTIDIGPGDNNFHFLTVVSPAQFNDSRKFTLEIISTNGTSAQYSVNEVLGESHIFQFLFKGNITLRANVTGGNNAIVQALFLDDAALRSGLVPPTLLPVKSPR